MAITTLKYPSNIEDESFNTRRIVFMAIPGELTEANKKWYLSQKGSEIDKDKRANEMDIRCVITLPIPSSLSDQQQHEWSTESILSGAVELGSPILGKLGEKLANKNADVSGGLSTATTYVSTINTVASHKLGARKRVPNPGEFQTYKMSGLRSFSFSYVFIPETKDEAKSIIDIISSFKTYSSPSTDGAKLSLLSPFMWIINITNGVINKLMNLKVCVCTQVDVTYGTDKFDIFEDGMPKKITMNLNFSESELTYAENYNTGLETRANDAISVLSASGGFANSFVQASDENTLNADGGGMGDKLIEKGTSVFDSAEDIVKSYFDGFDISNIYGG